MNQTITQTATTATQALGNTLNTSGVSGLVTVLVSNINALLTTLLPGREKLLVFGFSLFLAFIFKNKVNAGIPFLVVMTVVFWSFFRYWGVGG